MDSETTADDVLLQLRDGVASITLNRPERLNAFAGTMRENLEMALGKAAQTVGVRVVVITGAGRAFSAGADLAVTRDLAARDDDGAFGGLVQAGMRVVRRICSLAQPVIAAINGPAAGAGASWRSRATSASPRKRLQSASASTVSGFIRTGERPTFCHGW